MCFREQLSKKLLQSHAKCDIIKEQAGVLELADEADSKSVGLITRAGSTPATGINRTCVLWNVGFCFITWICRNAPCRMGSVVLIARSVEIFCRIAEFCRERVIFYENEPCMEGARFLTLRILFGRTES